MVKMLVGKAPLTVIKHTNGSRSNITRGGVVPPSVDKADAKRLIEEGYLEELEIVEPDPEPDNDEDSKGGPTTIPEIEAVVGTDPEKAQTYLDAEMAKPKPRATLVASLEKVIADAEAAKAGNGGGGS